MNNTDTEEDIFALHREHRKKESIKRTRLRNRAKEFLQYRYSQDPPLSYGKIGEKYGITRQRVYQILRNFN